MGWRLGKTADVNQEEREDQIRVFQEMGIVHDSADALDTLPKGEVKEGACKRDEILIVGRSWSTR